MASAPRSVKSRKAERELFFWTARQALMLVTLGAMTFYFVASLIANGEPAGMRELLDLISKGGQLR